MLLSYFSHVELIHYDAFRTFRLVRSAIIHFSSFFLDTIHGLGLLSEALLLSLASLFLRELLFGHFTP